MIKNWINVTYAYGGLTIPLFYWTLFLLILIILWGTLLFFKNPRFHISGIITVSALWIIHVFIVYLTLMQIFRFHFGWGWSLELPEHKKLNELSIMLTSCIQMLSLDTILLTAITCATTCKLYLSLRPHAKSVKEH